MGSKEGAVDAAEALCRGEGGAGTYRICRRDKVHDGTRHQNVTRHLLYIYHIQMQSINQSVD